MELLMQRCHPWPSLCAAVEPPWTSRKPAMVHGAPASSSPPGPSLPRCAGSASLRRQPLKPRRAAPLLHSSRDETTAAAGRVDQSAKPQLPHRRLVIGPPLPASPPGGPPRTRFDRFISGSVGSADPPVRYEPASSRPWFPVMFRSENSFDYAGSSTSWIWSSSERDFRFT